MPYIQLRGVDHYYEWLGSEVPSRHSATRPVMVFIHGWGGSGRYWQPTAAALQDRFDCLLYDMRGFGRSRLPQPCLESDSFELETYAEDLAALLEQLNLQRVYLQAHSTGASVAVFFLNLYPERVEKAILTCHGIFEYEPQAFSQFHRFGGYVVKFRPGWLARIPGMDRLFMARFLHRPIPKSLRQGFLEDFLMADYQAALGTMLTAVSQKAAEVMPLEFGRLQVPTLLISGERDQIIPVALGARAAALSSQVQHRILAQTAHFPMLEDPPTYLRCIDEFLNLAAAKV